MTFYLKPPKGLASVKNLEDATTQRLTCYQIIFSENIKDEIVHMDCLEEDSCLDRVGHYLFRLASLKNARFWDTFIRNEVKLLDIRLDSYSCIDAKFFIKKLKRQANECLPQTETGRIEQFYKLLVEIVEQLLREGFFGHAFKAHDNNETCGQCTDFLVKVPFEFCPDLVACREFDMDKGFVLVYSFQWKRLMCALYKTYLLRVLEAMRSCKKVKLTCRDDRIKNILSIIESLFSKGSFGGEQGSFKLESFESDYKQFPPCMRNLYKILKKNHRLGHNARFDFSVYLKEIGLSMDDAMTFWQDTYSQKHASCSKCTHSWQGSEKRYIYSIRHMYGLEGARKDYCVKSCQRMQEMSLGVTDEGGCPFKHFDDEHLRNLLKSYLPPKSSENIEVIIHERKRNSKRGCELFFLECFENLCSIKLDEQEIDFDDPAQYYLLFNRLIPEGSSDEDSI